MWGAFHRVHLTIMPIFRFFLQFLVDIMPLGSGSVDPHIFADPDPDLGHRPKFGQDLLKTGVTHRQPGTSKVILRPKAMKARLDVNKNLSNLKDLLLKTCKISLKIKHFQL